ncbi:MAG TPA: sensor domain-containing diguanylate cyclase [Dehalococcoidia bacterium]|nr:sensor domain-containing diguanylate cyclase [Dehalococcoidia bacterium]
MRRYPRTLLHRLANLPASIAGFIEWRRDYERLKASEARFRDLYENAPLAYFTVDRAGVVQGANRRARDLLASQDDTLVGKKVMELYADTPSGRDKAQMLFQRFKAGLAIDSEELEMRRFSGESAWVSLTVEPISDESGRVIASRSAVVDVSRRRALEEELRARVRLDPLTGALNHAAVVEELEARIESSPEPLTVCMVDLNGFKAVNDTYGHLTGDQVLRDVAQELSRPGATVGRFGGDEFLALVQGSAEQGRFFARRVGEALATFDAGGKHLSVAATFGFASYPDDSDTATELIRLADADMYNTRRARQAADRAEAV